MEKNIYLIKHKKTRKKVIALYENGLSMREIAKIVNKSHEWVRQVIHSFVVDRS